MSDHELARLATLKARDCLERRLLCGYDGSGGHAAYHLAKVLTARAKKRAASLLQTVK